MASSKEYIDFILDQLSSIDGLTTKKMFGEYMVFGNGKPVLLICDDTVYVKMLPAVLDMFTKHGVIPATGLPYKGAKEHYVLDIENTDLSVDMVHLLEEILPMPKPKKPKVKK